ncbi:hypothetical protein DPMN_042288 [Dreissena polymorpha]|uniref:Uncharacterized protein n=1 Tax=Dreissena polymorpha TaxID=45954 RepID=A0A9D4D1T9_DREPO|nr:hypothetical protein DPMN_042288 [Dreissena polymorpha]
MGLVPYDACVAFNQPGPSYSQVMQELRFRLNNHARLSCLISRQGSPGPVSADVQAGFELRVAPTRGQHMA